MKFHIDGTLPPISATHIFVFGSNQAGRHGLGAAKVAREQYGAEYGMGQGLWNRSYAIPTKDVFIEPLPLHDIHRFVQLFIRDAAHRSDLEFFVTAIGTGLAGFSHAEIAPMFRGSPLNCDFPENWREYL